MAIPGEYGRRQDSIKYEIAKIASKKGSFQMGIEYVLG